tara:strand:+ start:11380 stop:12279 length:900 start_codon:yes stop_codon:yes gene_type:complete
MRVFAVLVLESTGEAFEVGPGEIIGRSDSAALCVRDPRISEAHAMVSLRGQSLMLLPLRGRLWKGEKIASEIPLEAGLTIELAPELKLRCEEVSLSSTLLGISVPGLPSLCLTSTLSLLASSPPKVVRGYVANADAVFWTVGPIWYLSHPSGEQQRISLGDVITIKDLQVEVVPIAVDAASKAKTQHARRALTLLLCGEAVQVDRPGGASVLIGGIPGRILAALLRAGRPLHWQSISAEVWEGELATELALRKRFDVSLARLRTRLAPLCGKNESLVVLDGAGTVALNLADSDQIELAS